MTNNEAALTPVAAAVEPLRAAAVDHAAAQASDLAARSLAAYESGEFVMDLTVQQIYSMGRTEKALHNAKVDRLRSLCTVKGGKFTRDEAKIADFIEAAKERANGFYTSFIAKLEKKIGAHEAARLEGNHVWSSSVLFVTKSDGSAEKWFTQQITNVSSLGRPFPQWPSRKVK